MRFLVPDALGVSALFFIADPLFRQVPRQLAEFKNLGTVKIPVAGRYHILIAAYRAGIAGIGRFPNMGTFRVRTNHDGQVLRPLSVRGEKL